MKPAVRIGDISSGHGCWPSRPVITGSENVFINNKQAVRIGDIWQVHCCMGDCHIGVSIEGSRNVFINNRQIVRIGDRINCGGIAMEGSQNVFIGG